MEKYLGIAYKLKKSENFDQYMRALGVNLIIRKFGNSISPIVKLVESEGVYTLITTSTFKDHIFSFTPGVEFQTVTPDGRKVTTVVTFEGNKMIEKQMGVIETTVIREFSTNHMKAEFIVGNIVCKRYYERLD